ncbi:MAG: twin-arginine translocase subunit TatC, partial [Candidatus Latescibacterota bacterium]|nr:twin-arginine translocase subunit TatC [Candidatus Latescibacterota bacterium]
VESSDQSVDQSSGESSGTTVVDSADVPSVEGEGEDSKQVLPYRRQLQSLRVMTWFIVSLQVALLGGLILASPIVFYQLWRFVAPGLLNKERRLVLPIIGLSVFCFLLGAAVAHQIVLPLGLRFFLSLEPADMISQWAVDEYIGFVLRLLLGFGVVFEMPVVSLFLSRLGLLTPDYLRRVRRYAVVGIFLVAAVFTPPDPISQLLMALPLMVLYEISIGVSHLAQRKPVSFDDDDDDPESEPPPPSDDDERAGPPDTLT